MIILIGGSSHVGKTLVASKLMERLNIPFISLDHLKMGFIRTGRTELTVNDDYEMRYFLWPFAAEMIKTQIENGQSCIYEGCYIPSEWRESFPDEYLKEIKCMFIVMSEGYIRGHFDSIEDYADVVEKRTDDHPDMERLVNCSREFKEECIERDIPYFEIDIEFDTELILEKIKSL